MLNPKTNQRELAYVVKIDEIRPIEGRDRVECAVVGGWTVMVRKDQFKAGDLAIYFEIDSKVPEKEPYEFLASKHYKIKTQKYKTPSGHFWSQGLIMAAKDFGWEFINKGEKSYILTVDNSKANTKDMFYEGDFLTEKLGVTYADFADNKRKANSADKYKLMCQRHPKVFRNPFVKWLYRKNWGKKLLFIFFGKGAKKKVFPEWVVKTDEERIQNLVPRIPEFVKEAWIATEKVDGTSTTFTMLQKDKKLIVCSRNVVMNQPGKEKTCYYAETDGNVYVEMAEKYNMNFVLKDILKSNPDLKFVTVQGETYGGSIQKRNYSIDGHDLAVFNVIYGYKNGKVERLNPWEGQRVMETYHVPYVPIIGGVTLPESCEEILEMAGGESKIDGGMREGLVFRSIDGSRSFKAVDNNFLDKFH